MEIVVFKITGKPHGLLMNNPASMRVETQKEAGKLKVKAAYAEGQEEADSKAYKDEGGFLRFPSMAFRSTLIRAGTGRKIGKKAAAGVVKGTVFPAEDWVQILDATTWKPTKEYLVHTMSVVMPTGGRIMRSRAQVKNWGCLVALEIDIELVDPKDILALLNLAGKTVGIGDFRPQCPKGVGGPYGRFSAEFT
jgi:hypothetical protein